MFVSHLIWALVAGFWFSGRAVSVLDCSAISPTLNLVLKKFMKEGSGAGRRMSEKKV